MREENLESIDTKGGRERHRSYASVEMGQQQQQQQQQDGVASLKPVERSERKGN